MERPIRRAKKPRTKYSTEQVSRLERMFEENRYPDTVTMEILAMQLGVSTDRIADYRYSGRYTMETIALQLGVTIYEIDIWFQNRRSKLKRRCQEDHMTWMRKQIFHGGSNVIASPASRLPVFHPACHVLSPLESVVSGRDFPADVTSTSPYTPVHQVRRPNHKPSQRIESPTLPHPTFNAMTHSATPAHTPSPVPGKENQHPVISNQDQLFRDSSPYPVQFSPAMRLVTSSMCGYDMFPFLPVTSVPVMSFHQTVFQPHHSPRAPFETSADQSSTPTRTIPPKPQYHHDPRPLSVRRMKPLSSQKNTGTSHQDRRPEMTAETPSYPANFSVDPLAKTLFPDQFECAESSTEVGEDKELADQLLQEKALECLAQWC